MIYLMVAFISAAFAVGYWVGARRYVKVFADTFRTGTRIESDGGADVTLETHGAVLKWNWSGKTVAVTLPAKQLDKLLCEWGNIKDGQTT